jgi:CheY-like chemotaxis protein
MPVKDGWQATMEIREREERGECQWVPIVAVTGNTDHGDRERCLGAGMDAYMSKPVQSRAVLKQVKHWVAVRRQRRSEAERSESSALLSPG